STPLQWPNIFTQATVHVLGHDGWLPVVRSQRILGPLRFSCVRNFFDAVNLSDWQAIVLRRNRVVWRPDYVWLPDVRPAFASRNSRRLLNLFFHAGSLSIYVELP